MPIFAAARSSATASVFQRRQRIHVNSTEYPRTEALTSHILNSLWAEHLWCNFGKPANAWAARWKAWLRKWEFRLQSGSTARARYSGTMPRMQDHELYRR